jgi:hypothetical protein
VSDDDDLKRALRSVLDEGTGFGQTSWAHTSSEILAVGQDLANRAASVERKLDALAVKLDGLSSVVDALLGLPGPGWRPPQSLPEPEGGDEPFGAGSGGPTYLVLCPHPDDEVSVADLPASATFAFVYLTQGERTQACAGTSDAVCRAGRLLSTVAYLAAVLGGPSRRLADVDGHPRFAGPSWVAVFMDSGDGNVTTDEAAAAIAWAVARWRPAAIVSAAYEGPDYTHRDHAAVRAALPAGALDRNGFTAELSRSVDRYGLVRAAVVSFYGWLGGEGYLSLPAWSINHTYATKS